MFSKKWVRFLAVGLIGLIAAISMHIINPSQVSANESVTTTPEGSCTLTAGQYSYGGGAGFMFVNVHFHTSGSERIVEMVVPPEYIVCQINQALNSPSGVDGLFITAMNHPNPLFAKSIVQWLFLQTYEKMSHPERIRYIDIFHSQQDTYTQHLVPLWSLYTGEGAFSSSELLNDSNDIHLPLEGDQTAPTIPNNETLHLNL